MRTGNKRIKKQTNKNKTKTQRKPAALKCAQGKGVDQLVHFPFPRAVSSSSLLVQVPQVDEESCGETVSVSMKLTNSLACFWIIDDPKNGVSLQTRELNVVFQRPALNVTNKPERQ